MKKYLLTIIPIVYLYSCNNSMPLRTAIVSTPSNNGPTETASGCPTSCYDGTEEGLLAGCATGTPTCIPAKNSDGGIGQEIISCAKEQPEFNNGVCGPFETCSVAETVNGTPIIACEIVDGG